MDITVGAVSSIKRTILLSRTDNGYCNVKTMIAIQLIQTLKTFRYSSDNGCDSVMFLRMGGHVGSY